MDGHGILFLRWYRKRTTIEGIYTREAIYGSLIITGFEDDENLFDSKIKLNELWCWKDFYIYICLEYRIDFKELMKKFGRERD